MNKVNTLWYGPRPISTELLFKMRTVSRQANNLAEQNYDTLGVGSLTTNVIDENEELFEISLCCIGIRIFSQDDCLNRVICPKLFSHLCIPKIKQERHRFCMGLINTAEVRKNINLTAELKDTNHCIVH
jgi:hypothetical protein